MKPSHFEEPFRTPHPLKARDEAFARLGKETFDLLIIGGGITGCGVARDAALRGLKVALVEKNDFAYGTSSKSSKLIHGGLRYLEQGHLRLVFEGTNERALQLRVAPHLVTPLPFLVPAYAGAPNGLLKLDIGLWLYDALSLFSSPKLHRTHFANGIRQIEPGLRDESLKGGIVYYDCMTDDARLTLENALDARGLGAVVVNYARATTLLKNEQGHVIGAEVADVEPSVKRTVRIQARVTVNATGPWTDEIRALLGQKAILKPTKGVHLVLDAKRLGVNHALLMNARKDGRVMFTIPWGNRTVLGTTDTFYSGSADDSYTTRDDAEYILETANHYYPKARLTLKDVLSTWSGLRPLVAPDSDGLSASDVSREHFLIEQTGFLTISGGKLTTYRRIAKDVVDAATRQLGKPVPCTTDERPLPGANGLVGAQAINEWAEALTKKGLEGSTARHLVQTYGARSETLAARLEADLSAQRRIDDEAPWNVACVDEATEYEMALTLSDMLERRAPLILKSRDQGLSVAKKVAERMARRLEWDTARVALEVERYRESVALSRRFLDS